MTAAGPSRYSYSSFFKNYCKMADQPGDDDIRSRVRERLSRQRALVGKLLRLREQLQGSLFVR